MEFYIGFAGLLFCLLVVVELLRNGGRLKFDFLFVIACAFMMLFVIAPVILLTIPADDPILIRYAWMAKLPADTWAYQGAAAAVIASFASIHIGYRLPWPALDLKVRPTADPFPYFLLGTVFLTIGMISTFLYTEMVGGFGRALLNANILREGFPDAGGLTSFSFFKRLCLFCLPATVFFTQAVACSGEEKSIPLIALCCAAAYSAIVLVFMSGRLSVVAFVVPFLLPVMGEFSTRAVLIACGTFIGFVLITLFGKTLMNMITLGVPLGYPLSPLTAIRVIALEFGFPFLNILSVIERVPDVVGYRMFLDIPTAFLRLIPQRLFPLDLPEKLADINTTFRVGKVSWGIPVDLISFGWYSLGAVGVIVVSLAYGKLLRVLDSLVPGGSFGNEVFRGAWMLFAAIFVMYGDPAWVFVEQFHWWVALVAYLTFCLSYARHPATYRTTAPYDVR